MFCFPNAFSSLAYKTNFHYLLSGRVFEKHTCVFQSCFQGLRIYFFQRRLLAKPLFLSIEAIQICSRVSVCCKSTCVCVCFFIKTSVCVLSFLRDTLLHSERVFISYIQKEFSLFDFETSFRFLLSKRICNFCLRGELLFGDSKKL